MGIEIERKFLVVGQPWVEARAVGVRIQQGYLSREPQRTVRIRRTGEGAWITIKGKNVGASRPEFEYAIPLADAEPLLALCEPPVIEKTRYRLPHAAHVWEVDVFAGANAGLVVAEVEMESEDEAVELPSWVGAEVTSDRRYSNSSLASHPYRDWPEAAGRG